MVRVDTRKGARVFCVAAAFACMAAAGCRREQATRPGAESRAVQAAPPPSATPANAFDRFMAADYPPADGFDLPVPATSRQTASDSVRTTASGRVVAVELVSGQGTSVVVEHTFYENNSRQLVWSIYGGLSKATVDVGQQVARGQAIGIAGPRREGRPGVRPFELRRDQATGPTWQRVASATDRPWINAAYVAPDDFIRERPRLPVPQRESTLVLVDQISYTMRVYGSGRALADYDISLGQGKGQKRVQGDNRTPKGMYFVVDKRHGEFAGPYGAYYGGHWIKISYPNKFDAERGLVDGLVDRASAQRISAAWARREATDGGTRLGGGIGFHGWIREWANSGPRHLSWGCVVMHVKDIGPAYDLIPIGAMVVIF